MSDRPTQTGGISVRLVTAIVLAAVIVSAGVVATSYFGTSTTVTRTVTYTTTTISTKCSITGQPAGFFLRVLSDSTSKPAADVIVIAVNRPALCDGSSATNQTVDAFTTNGTEWHRLPSDNNVAYSLIANYLGHTYNLTAGLSPVSVTCATLFVPSGRTNTTSRVFQTSCG